MNIAINVAVFIVLDLCTNDGNKLIIIESMMGLGLRQGNLRLVFRLFSLMRGLPSTRLK